MEDYVVPQKIEGVTSYEMIPAVWWGVSVAPNRVLGCHVVLENGAMVVDLPLHALRWHKEPRQDGGLPLHTGWMTWDCYGWDAEIVQNDYLTDMHVEILDESHKMTHQHGNLWFAIDHVRGDGFSLTPAQHKHLWVVAMQNGTFSWVPQDQMLLHDKSFTEVDCMDVPRIKRQDRIWSVE
jgi:hypothetical protein